MKEIVALKFSELEMYKRGWQRLTDKAEDLNKIYRFCHVFITSLRIPKQKPGRVIFTLRIAEPNIDFFENYQIIMRKLRRSLGYDNRYLKHSVNLPLRLCAYREPELIIKFYLHI